MNRPLDKQHWADRKERGSFWLMKLTAVAAKVLGRRLLSPLLYGIVLYFFLFGRNARQSIWQYQQRLADWSGHERAQRLAVLPQTSSLGFAFRVEEVVGMGRLPAAEGRNLERLQTRGAGLGVRPLRQTTGRSHHRAGSTRRPLGRGL